jgi:signal transduction histidine kinase
MRPLAALSLRLRLTLWYTGILAATLLVVSIIVYVTLSFTLNQQVSQFLGARAKQYISVMAVRGLRGPDANFLRSIVAQSNPDTYADFVAPDGNVTAYTSNLPPTGWPQDPAIVAKALRTRNTQTETLELGDAVFRVDNFPVFAPDDGRPLGVLQLGRDVTQMVSSLRFLREVLILAFFGSLFVAFGAGWFLASRALRPISRVAETAQEIGDSRDFSRRVTYSGPPDEMGKLIGAFNDMLGHIQTAYHQIENALSAQRRFVADASHELRTPLTTIRGNLGLLAGTREVSTQDRQEALEDMASEAERMSRLVSNLLVLARADAGLHVQKGPVRLDDIMEEVYRQARVLNESVTLRLHGPQPAEVEGSADYLKQLLLILVDNALKNTQPGGRVDMADPCDGGWVRLMVSDTGRGIPPEALPHIFERFYQADKSRSGGGTGLGLAIAKWIAEEHGGRIEATSQPGLGSTFTVWLPLAGQAPAEPPPAMTPVSAALG